MLINIKNVDFIKIDAEGYVIEEVEASSSTHSYERDTKRQRTK